MIAAFDPAAFEAGTVADRKGRAMALDAICRETGFLLLNGHGLPAATVADVRRAMVAFFDSDPSETARPAPLPGQPYGWIGSERGTTRGRRPRQALTT